MSREQMGAVFGVPCPASHTGMIKGKESYVNQKQKIAINRK
jgi:hypothetical protein